MAAGLATMICSGCNTDSKRYAAAEVQVAVAQAPTILPDWPPYCSEPMPTVVPKPQEKWRWVQGRWEIVRDGENRRVEFCSKFYADAKANAAGIK